MTANPKIEALRRRVSALESPGQGRDDARVPFGFQAADLAAGGGLALGRMHEFTGWSAQALAIFMAGRCNGAILWCARMHGDHTLYAPGFAALGCDARRLVVAECSSATDALWAAEEGLRSGAAGAVVIEGSRPPAIGQDGTVFPDARLARGNPALQVAEEAAEIAIGDAVENDQQQFVVHGTLWETSVICGAGAVRAQHFTERLTAGQRIRR